MKQPDLDEEALRLQVQGKDLMVVRQTMADTVAPVTVTSPSGATRELTLSAGDPGEWRATMPAERTRPMAGDRRHAEGADQCRPDQSEGIFGSHLHDRDAEAAGAGDRRRRAARGRRLQHRAAAHRAGARLQRFHGDGWMGVKMRDASVVKGVGVLPIFAGLIGLLLLLGAFAATWLREGR